MPRHCQVLLVFAKQPCQSLAFQPKLVLVAGRTRYKMSDYENPQFHVRPKPPRNSAQKQTLCAGRADQRGARRRDELSMGFGVGVGTPIARNLHVFFTPFPRPSEMKLWSPRKSKAYITPARNPTLAIAAKIRRARRRGAAGARLRQWAADFSALPRRAEIGDD